MSRLYHERTECARTQHLTQKFIPQVGNTESVAANQAYTSTYPVTLSLDAAGAYKCAASYQTQQVGGQTLSAGTVFSGQAEIVVFGEFLSGFLRDIVGL